MNIEYKISIRENVLRGVFDIFYYRKGPGHSIYLLKQDGFLLTEEEVSQNGIADKATLSLSREMLQQLADELEKLRIKPEISSKVEGLYEAQSEHLKDLRTILKLPPTTTK